MSITQNLAACVGGFLLIAIASGQATSPMLDVRTVAEVEVKVVEDGGASLHLLPATRVVPGDLVIYSVEIRNTGSKDAVAPTVTQPVPEHMAYVADSATGPGAEITYSADGGTTFDRPEGLKALGPDGKMHVVKARDYTHIRWQFKIVLKSKSVAYARFRAVVK
jgi:uncharacterized repeat protein (TIGR01451 family)